MLQTMSSLLVSATAFVAVLSVVVFVHEFGHFQVSRWFKIQIKSFSIGFGAPLFQRRDKHGTVWKISGIPLGGFVSYVGDADATSVRGQEPFADAAARERARRQGLYQAQPPAVRALTAFAGPGANFVFAIAAFAVIAMIFGHTDVAKLPPRVDGIEAASPGARAGFQVNDMVVAVQGKPIATLNELKAAVRDKIGVPLSITVRRNGELVKLTATPAPAKEVTESGVERQIGRLGIGPVARPADVEHPGLVEALGLGVEQTGELISSTFGYIGNMITGKASTNQLAGPVGIAQMAGQVANNAVQQGTWFERVANLCASLASLAALLSVAVGIVNLMPVPVLDGGLILFCAIEAVRGRPLDAKAQEIGVRAGLAAIASLFLLATWNDLQRLNLLEFLRGMLS